MTQPLRNHSSEVPKLGASDRAELWAGTMTGQADGGVIRAHAGRIEYIPREGPTDAQNLSTSPIFNLEARLEAERLLFSPSATLSTPGNYRASNRVRVKNVGENMPLLESELRTRFEIDVHRIKHFSAFRSLAGKTQVHLNPSKFQRTRLTHTNEVEQIAGSIAIALRLNVHLASAIALGHDCGHGPGGHASEDALDPYLPGGFNHARFGADVTLKPLNLCYETTDGIRNHSWSLDTPGTPEAEVVAFADRIAYVCHDLEDALGCGIVQQSDFPAELAGFMSQKRGAQIDSFINAVILGTLQSSSIAMLSEYGEILGAMRAFNLEHIYKHPDCEKANADVVSKLQQLVEHFQENPRDLPDDPDRPRNIDDEVSIEAIVTQVAGMTDAEAYSYHSQLIGKGFSIDSIQRNLK